MSKKVAEKGQALIELILAIAIATMLLGVLATGAISAREGLTRSDRVLDANTLLQKEIEVVRSIREIAWNSISNPGTYHVEQSGNNWIAAAGTITENGYTRGFTVNNVCRTSAISTVINCSNPQAINDPSTKEITAQVSWSFLGTQSVSSTFYISRYFNNQTWTQTTKADFDAGIFDNTRSTNRGGGTVELQVGGGQSFADDYLNESDYNFDSNKIEVVGGYAQLKAQGSLVTGSTTNPDFGGGSGGWAFVSWRDSVGQSESYQSSGGNPGGYIQVNLPAARKKVGGGYWYQSFTTTVANPTATLSLDWRSIAYQAIPDSFRVYAFVDTTSGAPTLGQQVWNSGEITGMTSWFSIVNIDVSSKVTAAGTYYLKVAVLVDYPNNATRGPYTVGFDNVSLTWSKIVGSYPTDQPNIYRKIYFTAPSISAWTSFSATEVLNGGSIRYQLSDDDGQTWKFFNGTSWITATNPTDYNDQNTINNRISSFPTTNGKINVRAFLISNGSQFVRLDRIVIGYTGTETGTFTSTTFNAGTQVSFNRLFWTESVTASTSIRFQIAVNDDNATWNFFGPDGTAATYFTGGVGIVPLEGILGQYLRYKIFFTSASKDTPFVADVTINYSP
ncbi:MAG: hypothetical protein A2Z42_00585 [Candidatus Woykebacteria bacterium RBG_19FT_COMBO_43_10]|uniref:Uncharacterized protein n=1 Tax=Candidatus Woykebacteria bacterium RBG_19FT_COMBO_43_10 TaxID=1802598 RepID=A0A1G1WM29_9BACT|nr:MAG: hypothetical protein A2Z42_00585 [Candidatus Woykebacteria bacterium RBG_19FT_COMBO_43_10]